MRRGRREYLCDLTQKFAEIRSWSAAVDPAMSATGASAMACYGGQPASSFQNAVTVLHLETKLKLYIPTDSYKLYLYLSQLSARCWFEPTRLSTRRKRPSMAAAARAALAEALPRACAVPRRAL